MIYLIEDDPSIRDLVAYTLNTTGLDAKGFERPSEFWKEMKKEVPSLVLLDIMLPEEDGLSILKKLRGKKSTEDIPIIMLTAKGSEYDKVLGLDTGADDYIPKPFGMMELISRVKALLRRASRGVGERSSDAEEYRVGELAVFPKKYAVFVNDTPVTLTLREFELLLCLLENRGIVMSRDALLNNVWGHDFDGESRTVDVHIRTLRQKLGEAGGLIETVRGIGYKIGGEL